MMKQSENKETKMQRYQKLSYEKTRNHQSINKYIYTYKQLNKKKQF